MDYAVNTYNLYRDIQQRTGGEIYIGVLGPVRTGKSTFIKRFMDEMVLPYMEDEHARMRAQDELPQSAGGKTITTTEPKFIPNEAAKVRLNDDIEVSVRLIDCVGYMIDGAAGHMEEDDVSEHRQGRILLLRQNYCRVQQRYLEAEINGKLA